MNAVSDIPFYVGAAILCGLSVALIWGTAPYSSCGGAAYERKRTRRLTGTVLLVVAALALGMGLFARVSSITP
jgi:uncharacterized membrane protein